MSLMDDISRGMRAAVTHMMDMNDPAYADFYVSAPDAETAYCTNILAAYQTGLIHAGMRDRQAIGRLVAAYGELWLNLAKKVEVSV